MVNEQQAPRAMGPPPPPLSNKNNEVDESTEVEDHEGGYVTGVEDNGERSGSAQNKSKGKSKSKSRHSILHTNMKKAHADEVDMTYTKEDVVEDFKFSPNIAQEVADLVNALRAKNAAINDFMMKDITDANKIAELKDLIDDMKAQINHQNTQLDRAAELRDEHNQLKVEHAELRTQADDMQDHLGDLQKHNQSMKTRLEAMIANRDTPFSEPGSLSGHGPKLSSKLPDPPQFSGGKDDKLKPEDWVMRVRGKLQTNKDHYPEEIDKVNYIVTLIVGSAAEFISPRLQEDSQLKYNTGGEILTHLETIYGNPFKKQQAKEDYQGWKMTRDMDFHTFYTKFLLLAGLAKRPESELVDELKTKLKPYWELDDAVQNFYYTEPTLQAFALHCTQNDNTLKQKAKERAPSKGNRGGKGRGGGDRQAGQSERSAAATSTSSAGSGNVGEASQKEQPKRRYDPNYDPKFSFKCYNCNKHGHRARDCPEPDRRNTGITAMEENKEKDASAPAQGESGN